MLHYPECLTSFEISCQGLSSSDIILITQLRRRQWQQIGLFKSELNLIHKSRMSTQSWTETFVNSWSLQRWSAQWLWSFCLCRSWGSQKLCLCGHDCHLPQCGQKLKESQECKNYFSHRCISKNSFYTYIFKKLHRNSLPHRKVKMMKTMPLTVKSWFNIIKSYGILNSCNKQY